MKYFILVLVMLSSFGVMADPRIGPAVHIPQSDDNADIEDKCANCISKVLQDANGDLQTGYFTRTHKVPQTLRRNVWHSSAKSGNECILVDPDNDTETAVEYWRLKQSFSDCNGDTCTQIEDLRCSSVWYLVYE